MELINWFLKTGKRFEAYTGRWTKSGISNHMFNYSANSHDASFPFPIVCENYIGNPSYNYDVLGGFIQNCLFNAIIGRATTPVNKWRNAENVKIGKYRILQINTDFPKEKHPQFDNTYWSLQNLKKFIGVSLKKDQFHPTYPDRIDPKIINVIFYTNGNGYVFEYVFSFSNFGYEPGWSKYISQNDNESIPCFLNRIYFEMDLVIILNAETKKSDL